VYDPISGNFVDLRSYGLVTDIDDGAIAAANGKAISKAFLDRPANAVFVLPMGKTYVNRDLAGVGIHRSAALKMTALTDVVLTGWGPGATQLIMTGSQANGLSQVIQIYECTRVTIRDMTIAHGPNLSDVNTAELQNHHIEIDASSSDCTDVEIENVNFGPCIGDAVRVVGSAINSVVNGRVHHVTMRTGGHPLSPNRGSRSGISFQKGLKNFELANFFIHGAKNSPIDCEPKNVISTLTGLNIHDGVVDNSGGSTPAAISFGGFSTSNPLTNSRITNVNVIEGQIQVIHTDNCCLDNVTIYASGQAGMAGVPSPLLYVFQSNAGVKLRNVNITRDTGSAAGPLVQIESSQNGIPNRVEIEGGEWLTKVSVTAISDVSHVRLIDVNHFRMRGTRLRIEDPAPSGHIALLVKTAEGDITEIAFEGLVVESPNGLLGSTSPNRKLGVLHLSALRHNISKVIICGVIAESAGVNGILFDANLGGTMEPYPILQACDFSGCTNQWDTDHFAVVYPIVDGNKGTVCQLVGSTLPEKHVTAVQGSYYTFMNGDSTQTWGENSWHRQYRLDSRRNLTTDDLPAIPM
jgi:hypothetical protein